MHQLKFTPRLKNQGFRVEDLNKKKNEFAHTRWIFFQRRGATSKLFDA
jgi:hypothetical protein